MLIVRLGLAIPIAVIVTISLFALMSYLIATGETPLNEVRTVEQIDFKRVKREEVSQVADNEMPDKPQEIEAPPPPPPTAADAGSVSSGGVGGFGKPKLNTGLQLDRAGIGSAPEGDVLPLVRVAPQYPQRAMSRGIEGWVQLRFSINATGTPYNVIVISADPPGYFETAAQRSVEKWKYKPKVENGQPTERHGVEVVISFDLEGQ